MKDEKELLGEVRAIARRAGGEIMEVYARSGAINVQDKADDSPLTEADTRAHRLIEAELSTLELRLPVLSEESDAIDWAERRQWSQYWLVDPLDGTKEFINRNDEFTVNIALVRDGRPVLGVVHVPALGITYSGLVGQGAWRQEEPLGTSSNEVLNEMPAGKEPGETVPGERASKEEPISVSFLPGSLPAKRHSRSVETDFSQLAIRVVASRRHRGEELQALLESLERKFAKVDMLSMGSSLKICLVAEGRADLYPRLAPTSEWDTAAAQAVLVAAGGALYSTDLKRLDYNQKEDLLNPHFVAVGDPAFPWKRILG